MPASHRQRGCDCPLAESQRRPTTTRSATDRRQRSNLEHRRCVSAAQQSDRIAKFLGHPQHVLLLSVRLAEESEWRLFPRYWSRGSRKRVAASRRDHCHRAVADNEEEAPVLQDFAEYEIFGAQLRWLAGIGELLEQLALRWAEHVYNVSAADVAPASALPQPHLQRIRPGNVPRLDSLEWLEADLVDDAYWRLLPTGISEISAEEINQLRRVFDEDGEMAAKRLS